MDRSRHEKVSADFAAFEAAVRKADRALRALVPSPQLLRELNAYVKDAPFELAAERVLARALTADLSVAELRAHVRQLRPWVLNAVLHARAQRRQRPKSQHGARTANKKRRAKVQSLPDTIATIKRKGRATSDTAAAIVHLKTDPTWHAGTAGEQKRMLDAFLRRLRRARKNRGHAPG